MDPRVHKQHLTSALQMFQLLMRGIYAQIFPPDLHVELPSRAEFAQLYWRPGPTLDMSKIFPEIALLLYQENVEHYYVAVDVKDTPRITSY